jgi:hypothetical protein
MKATATALDLQVSSHEPEDHQAVAASCHHATPDTQATQDSPDNKG